MPETEINIDTLWLVFGFIGTNWGNAQFCTMPRQQFGQAVMRQIERDQAYASYYTAAVNEYDALLRQYGRPDLALMALFRENQLPNPKLPNVANYVLLEFMRWQIAFGGFRAFGYENYNGWMGGGSFLQVPPPYRALAGAPPYRASP